MDVRKFNGFSRVSLSSVVGNNLMIESMAPNPMDNLKKKRNSSFSFREVQRLLNYTKNQKKEKISIPFLMLVSIDKVALKDFSTEVRAVLDIEKFLKEATIILDLEELQPIKIIESILMEMFTTSIDEIGPFNYRCLISEAKEALFTQIDVENHSYQRLTRTIKGVLISTEDGMSNNQSWICAMSTLAGINKRYLSITRLKYPVNFGRNSVGVHFVVLVLTPRKEKESKSDFELSRTFATLFSSIHCSNQILSTDSHETFRLLLKKEAENLAEKHRKQSGLSENRDGQCVKKRQQVFQGIIADIRSLIPGYKYDLIQGFRSLRSIKQIISAIIIMYFSILFVGTAFGKLYSQMSSGQINASNFLTAQFIGGIIYSIFGGQPLVILMSNISILLLIEVLSIVSREFQFDFFALYGWTGIFSSGFLMVFSVLNLSDFIPWSVRSFEEMSALFVAISFLVITIKDLSTAFQIFYKPSTINISVSLVNNSWTLTANSSRSIEIVSEQCNKDAFLLFILLIIGTMWMALYLENFTKTPFLSQSKRKLMADYSLPLSVMTMSFVGSYLFDDIRIKNSLAFFVSVDSTRYLKQRFQGVKTLSVSLLAISFGLAIPVSMVFYFDQNIVIATVNSASNRLKTKPTPNLDLLILGIINTILSICGFPWIHGSLVHSHLHVRILADTEQRIDSNSRFVDRIINVNQSRLSGLISHLLIGLTVLLIPGVLKYIPVAVLDGIFVYTSISGLCDNQLFERILLLVTEQAAYPPSHYLKRVPQRKVHLFTTIQVSQILILCFTGLCNLWYMRIFFPIFLLLQIPIRQILLPRLISKTYLDALD